MRLFWPLAVLLLLAGSALGIPRRSSDGADQGDLPRHADSAGPARPRRAFWRRQESFSNPEGYRLASLPNLAQADFDQYHSYAGVVPLNRTRSQLFFWLVTPKANPRPRTRPLILWLNGGPGCSSMDGLWLENGPYRVVENSGGDRVVLNKPNWVDGAGNMLFLDQPVGTGYSWTGGALLRTQTEMARDVLNFLLSWFSIFSDYQQPDFYISGESFAGTYIPYIARAILDYNALPTTKKPINLKGIAIGNGWIDPVAGYKSYISFADEEKLWKPDSVHRRNALSNLETCLALQEEKPAISAYAPCEQVLQDLVAGSREVTPGGSCVNIYDIRLEDTNPLCNGMSWPPGVDDMRTYLVRDDVVEAVNVNGSARNPIWDECSNSVYFSMDRDLTSAPSVTLFPGLLEDGLRVMLYSGKSDLICNWHGTRDLISELEWAGATGFSAQSALGPFVVRNGTVAGEVQHERNLTFLLLNEASHMAPFDQPGATSDMMSFFISDSFVGTTASTARTSSTMTTSLSRTVTVGPTTASMSTRTASALTTRTSAATSETSSRATGTVSVTAPITLSTSRPSSAAATVFFGPLTLIAGVLSLFLTV
ncbi:Alpha/Beta hydrolase protein [Hyaloraphidium curvatum]|nr:Alpha/Beta hydrolase protein [Hyaloraphidium curvatum]